MSTRLMLSGHNFSLADMPALPDAGEAVILLDTPKTLLLPSPIYESGTEEEYMRRSGFHRFETEDIVASEVLGDTVALMLFQSSVISAVKTHFGKCLFRSPLQEIISGKHVAKIFLTDHNVYIALNGTSLLFADVFPDRTPESIVYYVHTLKKEFASEKFDICVAGKQTDEVIAVMSKYYKVEKK